MSALGLDLSLDCYYVAVLFYVSLKSLCGTSTHLSVLIVHFCLLTFFVVLEEINPVASASSLLCIFIGSVPGL